MSMPTADDRTRRLRLVAVLLAGLGVTWLAVSALAYSATEVPRDVIPGETDLWGYDYRAYLFAAERLADGEGLYQQETLAGPYRPGPFGLYMYAPPLGVGLLPLEDIGLSQSTWLWYFGHVLALVGAIALMPVSWLVRLFVFAVAAFSFSVVRDMTLGNVSVLVLLPLAAAWRWLDRPAGAVAQALAMAVRPMLGVLLVWQALRRQWRAVAWTLGSGLLLIALTLPFVGLEGYRDYLTTLRNLAGVSGVESNYDLSSTTLALGTGDAVAGAALLAGYAYAIGAIVLSLRRDRELGFVVTATASLLLSPLLWDHYLAMLLLPAAFLAQRGRWWGLGLPLLSWLPGPALPFVVMAAVALPFVARDPGPAAEAGA